MNEIFPTLYKRDSTGKIRIWAMEINNDQYRTHAGTRDGKIVTSAWTVAKGKNTGKANETSAEEQALNEIESQYKKKLAVDYHENEADVDVFKTFKPMLAVDWTKRKDKIKWDISTRMQPKLDGVRCIASSRGLFTRNGKEIVSSPHINDELKSFFSLYPDVVLDGELYNHALKADFNKIISLVRKTKPKPEDILETATLVEYHVYDIADSSTPEMFIDRTESLGEMFVLRNYPMKMVTLVETDVVSSEEDCDQLHMDYLSNGYEGSIIRLNDLYAKNKRSNSLIKRKDFDDDEFEVVGYQLGTGNFGGLPKMLEIKLPDGSMGLATMTGSRDYLAEVLDDFDDLYRGSQATVQYFGYTVDGALRFPTVKVLHKGKREL